MNRLERVAAVCLDLNTAAMRGAWNFGVLGETSW